MSPRCPYVIATSLAILFAATACKPDKEASKTDSASVSPGPDVTAPTPVNTGWRDSVAGPVLLLATADNPEIASVVFPMMNDSALVHDPAPGIEEITGMSFDLFDRTGFVGASRLVKRAQPPSTDGCLIWPAVALDAVSGNWRMAFRNGVAIALPMDSLEGSTSADSTAITTELARLASALPASNDAAFQGLPFAVRKAFVIKQSNGSLLIGDIIRKINEEANPREERLLLIAERTGRSAYTRVFHSRAAGSEENVRTSEILGAVRFRHGGRLAIIVSFEYENGSRVALIEKTSGSAWRISWRSAYTGC